jgi:hypothetical protein
MLDQRMPPLGLKLKARRSWLKLSGRLTPNIGNETPAWGAKVQDAIETLR